MSLGHTVVLGAIAGFTIYLGLPVARWRHHGRHVQSLLSALALGVLFFLIWDIIAKALEPIEEALKTGVKSGHWGTFASLGSMLVLGLVAGLVGLVAFDTSVQGRRAAAPRPPRQLALMIATGLGLHNLSEGLAIGQAASTGEIVFAAILIVGFGLHNITEGFAVAAPLALEPQVPSWRFLGLAGLIGGGPTFLGTLIGYRVSSPQAFVLFLALAAGALIYIIGEMFAAGRRLEAPVWAASGIAAGFLIALGTDLILTAGGV
jgi:ZIP family zinc transporter